MKNLNQIFFLTTLYILIITSLSAKNWQEMNAKVNEHYQQGEYSLALQVASSALIQAEEEWGKEHLNYATTLYNLAKIYRSLKNFSEAETYMQQALKIRLFRFGDGHPEIAGDYNWLSYLYRVMRDFEKAIEYNIKATNIYLKFDEKHEDQIATLYNNLGKIYLEVEKYELAEKKLNEALALREKLFGSSHVKSKTIKQSLMNLYKVTGNNEAYNKVVDTF